MDIIVAKRLPDCRIWAKITSLMGVEVHWVDLDVDHFGGFGVRLAMKFNLRSSKVRIQKDGRGETGFRGMGVQIEVEGESRGVNGWVDSGGEGSNCVDAGREWRY